ncbi:hypothetical protein [Streptomyces sp. NPDC059742]|uniref:hypothetical protein n=1 Tax=Streptomyces sp. NPDC059742 TaxID=3346927 RepID=UPI003659F310
MKDQEALGDLARRAAANTDWPEELDRLEGLGQQAGGGVHRLFPPDVRARPGQFGVVLGLVEVQVGGDRNPVVVRVLPRRPQDSLTLAPDGDEDTSAAAGDPVVGQLDPARYVRGRERPPLYGGEHMPA